MEKQLQKENFYDEIEQFDYRVNKSELRVNDIFVRFFNKDPEVKPDNMVEFSS